MLRVSNRNPTQVLGTFNTKAASDPAIHQGILTSTFNLTTLPQLNLLGPTAIVLWTRPCTDQESTPALTMMFYSAHYMSHRFLLTSRSACLYDIRLCTDFLELFKLKMGCLKEFDLEIKFKQDAKPVFCKPRTPFVVATKPSTQQASRGFIVSCGVQCLRGPSSAYP